MAAPHSTPSRSATQVLGPGQTRSSTAPGWTRSLTSRPVKVWAVAGALAVAVQTYLYTAWLINGPVVTPLGSDPVPGYEKTAVITFEVLSCTVATGMVVYIVRQCLRERRISIDAAFVIAWMLCNWQDPLVSYLKPTFWYSAYFVNVGNWATVIPGFRTEDGASVATDILGTAGIGYLWFFLPPLIAVKVLQRVRRNRPDIRPRRAFLIALAVCGGVDLALEGFPVYLHMWGYPSAVHHLSVFGGTSHQFPLLEPLMWGSTWATCALLRFYTNDRGETVAERGTHTMRLGSRSRDIIRVLAITGAVNVLFAAYNFGLWAVAWLPDTTIPHYPSYNVSGACGHGNLDPCPAETTLLIKGGR